MSGLKVNLGSGGTGMVEGFVNVDNLEDYSGKVENLRREVELEYPELLPEVDKLVVMDATKYLESLPDNSVETLLSFRFVGSYFTNWELLHRKLEIGGTLECHNTFLAPQEMLKLLKVSGSLSMDIVDPDDNELDFTCRK